MHRCWGEVNEETRREVTWRQLLGDRHEQGVTGEEVDDKVEVEER
jgi:hypothetical protein